MKLSLQTLYHWFKNESYHLITNFNDTPADIYGYVLCLNEEIKHGTAILTNIADESGYNYKISYGNSYFQIHNAKIEDIINTLNNIFNHYNEWEHMLYDAMCNGSTLKEFIDIAHWEFNRPMFIKGDSSWVYAITQGYNSDTHPFWTKLEESSQKKTVDYQMIKLVSTHPKFQNIFSQKKPTIMDSPLYKGPVLDANIWIDSKRVCEITMLEHHQPFSESDIYLMETFSLFIEKYVLTHKSIFLNYQGLSQFFASMLEGVVHPLSTFRLARQLSGWSKNATLAVIIIQPKNSKETPMIGVVRDTLINSIPELHSFQKEDTLIGVINVEINKGYANLEKKISKCIPSYGFFWGMSYEFSDFRFFLKYYQQAMDALDNARNACKPYSTMYNIAFSNMLRCLKDIPELYNYTHPDINKLHNLDIEKNTEYLKTLFAYMICGQNFTDAANMLTIHRNTLIYRINTIKKITSLNLDDLNTRKLLLLSLLIINDTF